MLLQCQIILALLFGNDATAVEASFSREVPAGQWTGVELKNLPAAALLDVQVESDNPIIVALADSSFRTGEKSKPLFAGEVQRRLSFSILTRKADDHFLILDNRKGAKAANVNLSVRASRNGDAATVSPDGDEILERFETALHRVFVFEPITIRVATCDQANAYSVRGQIRLCAEYVSRIQNELQDRAKTQDVLVFALFHELGHTLMQQWQLPFYDDEEVSDQFATAALMMLGQERRVDAVVELFSARSAAMEAAAKLLGETAHPLSADRARNISRWVRQPEMLERWLKLYKGRMQTDFLEQLLSRNLAWINKDLIRAELKSRGEPR